MTGLGQSVLPTLGGLLVGAAGVGALTRRLFGVRDAHAGIFRSSPAPMWICDAGSPALLDVNDAALAMYGFTRAEFLSMPAGALGSMPHDGAAQHRTKTGALLSVSIRSQPVLHRGTPARLVFALDTTAQTRAEEQLREHQASLELAQRVARLGSYVYDYTRRTTVWSRELHAILATSPEEATADGLWPFDHPEDGARVRQEIESARKERREYDIDHRIVRADGVVRHVQERGYCTYDEAGKPLRNFGTVLDITARKEAEAALAHLAYRDQLTSLRNRAGLVARLTAILKERRAAGQVALFFLDLDRFKSINDTLGHTVGDSLILEVARRLQRRLHTDEVLARSGGDEFVIVAPAIQDRAHISQRANELLDTLVAPFTIAGREHTVAASIGISVYPVDAHDADAMLRNADVALYACKKRGGASFQYYTSDLQKTAERRFRLEAALRAALEQERFQVHYQPVVCAHSGAIGAVEALLRWHDPELGDVSPSEFIPFAEETGAIRSIGEWVFERVAAQAKAWSSADQPLRVWVNVSGAQLKDQSLHARLRDVLARHDLDGSLIGLELTESSFIDNDDAVVGGLHQIKALGVMLALDDFGVKYSSLEYLQRLPIDIVKIDRTFIEQLPTNRFNASIVRAIVRVAHDVGFSVTAEGVESIEQLETLRTLGCDTWQGFLFSAACPPQDLETLLRDRSAASYA